MLFRSEIERLRLKLLTSQAFTRVETKLLQDPKSSKDCNVFNLYKLIATEEKTSQLKEKYEAGNFGFGHAKQELFELICNKYSEERENFNHLMGNKDIIEKELQKGAEKARIIAKEVLMRVRENIGY